MVWLWFDPNGSVNCPLGALFPSPNTASKKESLAAWRQKEKVKYEAKQAAKEAAGEPNDDHIYKWRGPKGSRYRGYGKSYIRGSQSKQRSKSGPVASFTDCPYEIMMMIAGYLSEKEIDAVARCNSVLYTWLNPHLYETNIISGSSALYWAASKGNMGTLRLMTNFGADLHSVDKPASSQYLDHYIGGHYQKIYFGTPLHIAVKFGHMEMISILLKEGLDLGQRTRTSVPDSRFNPEAHNCLDIAMQRPDTQSLVIYLAKKGAGFEPFDKGWQTRAMYQILGSQWKGSELLYTFEQQISWLQMFLQMGADANGFPRGKAPEYRTPVDKVFEWVRKGFPERGPILLDILFEHGANVNHLVNGNRVGHMATPLHLASFLGWTETVKDLLSRGANIEARDQDDTTPLYWAVSLHHRWDGSLFTMDRNRYMIACYTSFEEEPDEEELRYFEDKMDSDLVWRGNVETVNLLLEHGADTEAEGSFDSPLPYWDPPEGTPRMTPQSVAAANPNSSFRAAFAGGLVSKKEGK